MSEIPRPNEWEMLRSAEELAQVNLDGGLNTADRRRIRAMARRAYHAERDLAAVTKERDRLREAIAEEAEGLLGHSELGQMPSTAQARRWRVKPIRDVRGGKGHQPAHDDIGYGVRTLCGLAFDYVEAKKVTCKTCLKLKRGRE